MLYECLDKKLKPEMELFKCFYDLKAKMNSRIFILNCQYKEGLTTDT